MFFQWIPTAAERAQEDRVRQETLLRYCDLQLLLTTLSSSLLSPRIQAPSAFSMFDSRGRLF